MCGFRATTPVCSVDAAVTYLGPLGAAGLPPSSDRMLPLASGLGDRLGSRLPQGKRAPQEVKCSDFCTEGSPRCGHPQGGCYKQLGDQDDKDSAQGHKYVFIKPRATRWLGLLAGDR